MTGRSSPAGGFFSPSRREGRSEPAPRRPRAVAGHRAFDDAERRRSGCDSAGRIDRRADTSGRAVRLGAGRSARRGGAGRCPRDQRTRRQVRREIAGKSPRRRLVRLYARCREISRRLVQFARIREQARQCHAWPKCRHRRGCCRRTKGGCLRDRRVRIGHGARGVSKQLALVTLHQNCDGRWSVHHSLAGDVSRIPCHICVSAQ